MPLSVRAQLLETFDGIDALQDPHMEHDADANGAVGTKQYLEWTNVALQAYDKVTFAPIWPAPLPGATPWTSNGVKNCNIMGDGVVLFDRIASRWVVAGHNAPGLAGPYYYCVAISSTDDLSSGALTWYAYRFALNPVLGANAKGHLFFPDWPKLGTWSDGYYLSFDALDVDQGYKAIGVVFCALDRADMLTGAQPRPMQCFSDPHPLPASGNLYLKHSPIPADIEGTRKPPVGRHEYFVSMQTPPHDGVSMTASVINLWDFHVDWATPAKSTLGNTQLPVAPYTPGCYKPSQPMSTVCLPEPALQANGAHHYLDVVGDRFMPRLAYRNFGTHESFLVSHTVRVASNSQQTGIRWYELHVSPTPMVFRGYTISPDRTMFRFMPSIAQDHTGNAAIGYSVGNAKTHPGIRAVTWNLAKNTKRVEIAIQDGGGDEENATTWGDYSSMTVDPVDDCTFWYVNEYLPQNETGTEINWSTKIAKLALPSCLLQN